VLTTLNPLYQIIIWGVGFLALAGCASAPPPEAEGADVVRPALGFAIDVPPGWTVTDLAGDVVLELLPPPEGAGKPTPAPQERAGESASAAAAPTAGGASPTARSTEAARLRHRRRTRPVIHVAVVDREGLGLAEWADRAVAAEKELQPDLEVLERRPARLAAPGGGAREALDLVLRTRRSLEPLRQRLRLVMTDRRAYAVIATAPESRWPGIEAQVRACFDSLVVWD